MTDEILDYNMLDELKLVMEDDFQLLIDTFIADSDEKIAQLSGYDTEADPDLVRRSAHSLKGSSANVGATALSEASRILEDQAKDGDLSNLNSLKANIIDAYESLKEVLLSRYSN